jgi:hypothetical protein
LTSTGEFREADREATQAYPTVIAATAETTPEVVGNYRLLRPLGSGGMGSVYEAEDRDSGRRVAVKVVSAEHRVSQETLERFRQEGRLASGIAHPRCVFVLAADEEAGRPYIVMELMPGATLNDLVTKDGPLAIEDAIGKILDVIEGLQEAHRLGVIHRDVKPSNCFVAEDGRVKIGDFGLAKSLSGAVHLTRTGSFLGTPLFASPEQIRNDPLNEQTDVYSVAATLYFLLTGRAPFHGRDATATLARIVADPAPSMQTLRPEIPVALDKVVLKGLERNRERRYHNLEDFRRALLPFLTDQFSIAGLGLRFGAYLIDWLIFTVVITLLVSLFRILRVIPSAGILVGVAISWGILFAFWLYFAAPEWIWGCSLGKWITGLRVRSAQGREPPGILAILLRTLIFILLLNLGSRAMELFLLFGFPVSFRKLADQVTLIAVPVLILLGWVLLLAPMRARNGYRGLHEWASGTRVIRLRRPKPRRVLRARLPHQVAPDLFQPEGLPEHLGAFTVRGAITWSPESSVLIGEDPALQRQVWIWLRPLAAAPLAAIRHRTDRSTRLRWLAGGKDTQWQWDAFLAPSGTSITNLIRDGSLTWAEVRPLFEELSDELATAEKEGTLPDPLTVDQVWIQPTGRVQLLDMSVPQEPTLPNTAAETSPARGLVLLHEFAALTLEGRPRHAGDMDAAIRSPLPGHAADLLRRLRTPQQPFANLEQVQTALRQTQNRPTELTRSQRFRQLVASAILHAFALGLWAIPFATVLDDWLGGWLAGWGTSVYFASFMVLAAVWSWLTHGGLSFPITKVALVDAAGRPASRKSCTVRTALFWAPWLALVGFVDWIEQGANPSGMDWAAPLLPYVALALLAGVVILYLVSAFWSPARSFPDRLAGTFVVPR